jgi:hypothetical protein
MKGEPAPRDYGISLFLVDVLDYQRKAMKVLRLYEAVGDPSRPFYFQYF